MTANHGNDKSAHSGAPARLRPMALENDFRAPPRRCRLRQSGRKKTQSGWHTRQKGAVGPWGAGSSYTRPYDSEDGTRSSRVKKTAVTRVLRSVSVKKTTQPQVQHEVVDLDEEETVAERVKKLLALQG